MSNVSSSQPRSSIGIVGFGAFGRLLATHLAPHFALRAYDPLLPPGVYHGQHAVEITHLPTVAGCPIVVLATPVRCLADVIGAIGPHLKPGAVMIDVGSVKSVPAELMLKHLPADVGIVATHPLFGPQSARSGIRGLKIAVCPVRGRQGYRVAAFLRKTLGLDVIVTTPDAHDRDAATVQGLTHLVAKILIEMEPLPTRMTTRSFDLLMQAVGMVRADAPDVFDAIERLNPYARGVRQRFLALASSIDAELAERHCGDLTPHARQGSAKAGP